MKNNRFIKQEVDNFNKEANSENAIEFAGISLAFSAIAWYIVDYFTAGAKSNETLPVFAAVLAPILWIAYLSAKSRLTLINDLEAEATEAVEATIELQQQAQTMIEKASDYDRLQKEYDRLAKDNDRLKKDNDRCWQEQRLLEEKLTTVRSNATTVLNEADDRFKEASALHEKQLQAMKMAQEQLKSRISAMEEAIRLEGEVGSLNGRSSQAKGVEKEEIEARKIEQRQKIVNHLSRNPWLSSLKASWGGVKV
jgi:hypothetical protein